MCTPNLYQAMQSQQSQAVGPTDSDITPDGSEPLLIRNSKPEAPPGYVARFMEGRWRIVPDPNTYGVNQFGQDLQNLSASNNPFLQGPKGFAGSGGDSAGKQKHTNYELTAGP